MNDSNGFVVIKNFKFGHLIRVQLLHEVRVREEGDSFLKGNIDGMGRLDDDSSFGGQREHFQWFFFFLYPSGGCFQGFHSIIELVGDFE